MLASAFRWIEKLFRERYSSAGSLTLLSYGEEVDGKQYCDYCLALILCGEEPQAWGSDAGKVMVIDFLILFLDLRVSECVFLKRK